MAPRVVVGLFVAAIVGQSGLAGCTLGNYPSIHRSFRVSSGDSHCSERLANGSTKANVR
jgi:hypothetical protein